MELAMPNPNFSNIAKSRVLFDQRNRPMRFPDRSDYINFLIGEGFAQDPTQIFSDSQLVEAIYLDWLRRGQAGCVFAQLFGRPRNRTGLQTVVFTEGGKAEGIPVLTERMTTVVEDAITNPNVEAVTVLLPYVVEELSLATLIDGLAGHGPWELELERRWRSLTRIGLRANITAKVWAEVLGMGPFPLFPPTRQSPITSFEIRTKPDRAPPSRTRRNMLAGHLAQLDVLHFLPMAKIHDYFTRWTPQLRLRILGGEDDTRAKARYTFSIHTALWRSVKAGRS